MLCFSRRSKDSAAIEAAVQVMEATAVLADTAATPARADMAATEVTTAAMEATTVAMEATLGIMATITTVDMVTGIRDNLLVLEIKNARDALTRI